MIIEIYKIDTSTENGNLANSRGNKKIYITVTYLSINYIFFDIFIKCLFSLFNIFAT